MFQKHKHYKHMSAKLMINANVMNCFPENL